MRSLAFALLLSLAALLRAEEPVLSGNGKTVVLLHGVGLRSWSMMRLARDLQAEGYRVVNLTYPSRTLPIEQLGAEWLPAQLRRAQVDPAHADFVTHSMGGIVVRAYHRAHPGEHSGRIVMLAPPNAGSEVADHLARFAPFYWFIGVNARNLGTGEACPPQALGDWPADAGELGVIAGDRSFNPLFSAWLPGPDDGRVAVARTRLAGMKDFVVLHHAHSWIQWSGDASIQVRAFLREGKFRPVKSAAASAG